MTNIVASNSTALETIMEAETAIQDFFDAEGAFRVGEFVETFNRLDQLTCTDRDEGAFRRIQAVMQFIERVERDDELKMEFNKARRLRQVKPAQKNGNPYTVYVRTLFGWFREDLDKVTNDDGVEVFPWEVNKSVLSYAQVISELMRLNVPASGVADFIRKFTFNGTSGIKALEQSFTETNRDKRKPRNNEVKWKDIKVKHAAHDAEGLCEIEMPLEVQKLFNWIDSFCNATLVRKNGKVKILCDAKNTAAQIVRTVESQKDVWKKAA